MITKIILLTVFLSFLSIIFYFLKKSALKNSQQPHKSKPHQPKNYSKSDSAAPKISEHKFENITPPLNTQDDDSKQRDNRNNDSNRKESSGKENVENLNAEDKKQLDEIIERLKNAQVRPMSNQQRNLDREEGGVENEVKETESHIIDEWDSRSEDIVAMGKEHPINNSSAKKSMLWNLKRKKLQEKKIKEELEGVSDDLKKLKNNSAQQEGAEFDSRKKQSLTQRINALREDRSDFKPPSKIR